MNFKKAFKHIMFVEGGEKYTNHPNDKGGPTKYGITLKDLKAWRKDYSLTAQDVKNLTKSEAENIYKVKYWDAWRLDEVQSVDVATALLDHCVNAGIGKSSQRRVQRALRRYGCSISADGVIGPKTLKALNDVPAPFFILNFVKEIQSFYIGIVKRDQSQIVFLNGWINRTHILLDLILF